MVKYTVTFSPFITHCISQSSPKKENDRIGSLSLNLSLSLSLFCLCLSLSMYLKTDVETEREIYYEKLACAIMELGNPMICHLWDKDPGKRWCNSVQVWRPENQGSPWCKYQSQGRRRWRWDAPGHVGMHGKKGLILLPSAFCSTQALSGWEDAHPHWKGQSTLLS